MEAITIRVYDSPGHYRNRMAMVKALKTHPED